jgi:hypothetical protein
MVTFPLFAAEPGHVPTAGMAQAEPFQRSQVVFKLQLPVVTTERKSFNTCPKTLAEIKKNKAKSSCVAILFIIYLLMLDY